MFVWDDVQGTEAIARVPNGQLLTVLSDDGGDYVKVRWKDKEGYTRARNVKDVPPPW